ncbi:hypothetical protein IW261DRAFT_1347456 [Armillaria novae-zelandiae]|uniref:Uncharacterized protein n=1 Tax=Armillaria novae-zelandiae TaxID=153914 RepID=A0AA39TUQ8_9AGAR|nr:hypothetical protein IW261DRAFT_1347456 [Armillaria novae-zelandiae]
MIFCHISKDLKEHVLWLYQNDFIDDDVASLLDVSEQQYGSAIPPLNPFQGCPPLHHAEAMNDLISLSHESPQLFLGVIQEWLAVAHDLSISCSQLHQVIKDCAVTYKLMHCAAAELDKQVRDDWRQQHQAQSDACQILWIDETSKDDWTIYCHYSHSVSGECATISANFVHGDRYSLVAALGSEGYAAAHVIEGSVNGDEFLDFISYDVVSIVQNLIHGWLT